MKIKTHCGEIEETAELQRMSNAFRLKAMDNCHVADLQRHWKIVTTPEEQAYLLEDEAYNIFKIAERYENLDSLQWLWQQTNAAQRQDLKIVLTAETLATLPEPTITFDHLKTAVKTAVEQYKEATQDATTTSTSPADSPLTCHTSSGIFSPHGPSGKIDADKLQEKVEQARDLLDGLLIINDHLKGRWNGKWETASFKPYLVQAVAQLFGWELRDNHDKKLAISVLAHGIQQLKNERRVGLR